MISSLQEVILDVILRGKVYEDGSYCQRFWCMGCAANRKIGNGKSQRLINTPTIVVSHLFIVILLINVTIIIGCDDIN
jgi:hypothetical protein